ncbi:MAG: hypothetical protein WBF39_08505 [Planococcus donghaensis]
MEKQLFHHDKWEWMRIDVTSEKEIASLPQTASSKQKLVGLTSRREKQQPGDGDDRGRQRIDVGLHHLSSRD